MHACAHRPACRQALPPFSLQRLLPWQGCQYWTKEQVKKTSELMGAEQ